MKNLSTKELNYLRDFLSWELLSGKKCFQYAQLETDTQKQQLFYQAASIHQQNYMSLLDYANRINQGQGGSPQANPQGGQMN